MTDKNKIEINTELQRKRRFIFYIVFLIVFVIAAFFSGYRWAVTLNQYQTNWTAVASFSKWLNIVGLIMDLIGAFIVVLCTEGFSRISYMYNDSETDDIRREDRRNRILNWAGSSIFLIGMALQLISAILS
ncbi:MAG TPA: hypothetical protein DGG95_04755 [Cytophagales bacterium]|jgi:hypothetical protein|nr:hypothetical protein [Cytophagales bacterium]